MFHDDNTRSLGCIFVG